MAFFTEPQTEAGMSAFWAIALFFLILGIASYGMGGRREDEQQREDDYRDGYDRGYEDGYEDRHDDYCDDDHFDDDFLE